jgi:exopolysaccharide production protein ExoZ
LAGHLELAHSRHRIVPMEGLRGLAVLLVFLVHVHASFSRYLPAGSLSYRLSRFGAGFGNSGVDLFFVLSGYLIYSTVLHKQTPFFTFMKRRVERIYPTFLCVFGMYLLLSWLVPAKSRIPSDPAHAGLYLLANILLLPGMVTSIVPLITVAWSLSYEFFFYLTIPLLVSGTRMRTWPRRSRVLLFIALWIGHIGLYLLHLDTRVRLSMFLSGMILYEVLQSRTWDRRYSAFREVLSITSFGITLMMLGFLDMHHPVIAFLPDLSHKADLYWMLLQFGTLFSLVGCTFAYHGVLSRVFSWAPLRWLGNMSYSYYLLHGLIIQGLAMVVARLVPMQTSIVLFGALFLGALAMTMLGSFILFISVEKPFSLQLREVIRPERRTESLQTTQATAP